MWCRKILGCLDHQLLGWLEDGEGLGHVARAHSRFGRESTCSVSGTANDANRVVADGVADHRPLCRHRLTATVPDLRLRRQDDDAVRAYLVYNLRVALRDPTARSRVRPLGFDPVTASQVSRPVATCPANLNSAFRLRRSGTTETSLVRNLVTDLVTGHTCKRPSPTGKGPLTCDDVGSGGRI